ncbi:uncharacterized protein J4E78_000957 [Alternaria triticimaculans]|uniref:uncharacterized protein n=1 Tax=Alternaria triticimaculans TaxID=297637 RepID=UPI0020C1E944|nr:uncharacterized protein J4E78_000957 [Alternaria triticimaculans]KAI4672456.1 hypothetical protein J4E78_000957 [Alternaria triticimaculans]
MDLEWHLMPISEEEATLPQPPLPHTNPIADTRPRKKKARTLRETDWEPYKDRIIQLHHVDKRPLPEVRILIEQEFGFIAEIRQYRSRLTQWKLDKNIKPDEMKAIVRRRQQRSLVETDKNDLKFRVRGQEVEPHKIERWMKRHDVVDSTLYAPSPDASE